MPFFTFQKDRKTRDGLGGEEGVKMEDAGAKYGQKFPFYFMSLHLS